MKKNKKDKRKQKTENSLISLVVPKRMKRRATMYDVAAKRPTSKLDLIAHVHNRRKWGRVAILWIIK